MLEYHIWERSTQGTTLVSGCCTDTRLSIEPIFFTPFESQLSFTLRFCRVHYWNIKFFASNEVGAAVLSIIKVHKWLISPNTSLNSPINVQVNVIGCGYRYDNANHRFHLGSLRSISLAISFTGTIRTCNKIGRLQYYLQHVVLSPKVKFLKEVAVQTPPIVTRLHFMRVSQATQSLF